MYRVLLVDDDKEVLHINGEYLRGKGFQVCTAASAASALKKLEHFLPHCIVMEINIRRQNKVRNEAGVLEFPPLRIELVSHKTFYNKEEIPLSKREFELLVCLAKHPQEIMTFQQIGGELFGNYIDADRKNIMVSASRLRKKLEGYVGLENMIETAWGKGYCFKG